MKSIEIRHIKRKSPQISHAHDPIMEEETIIISALSTLSFSKLSDLSISILSITDRHHHRLLTLLSSPILFSLVLQHLHSLSLPNKTLLVARHLLFSLHLLTHHFQPTQSRDSSANIKQRDLDTVLILLLLCDLHQQNPEALSTPLSKWQSLLSNHFSESILNLSGVGVCKTAVLLPYIEMVTRCRRFIRSMGGGGKEGREVAASPAVVAALPSVEMKANCVECVICKEDMREGRDVCELPCQHWFHWMCILRWLRKRNTCPCCRFRLPTDDVYREIERLWVILVGMSSCSFDRECM